MRVSCFKYTDDDWYPTYFKHTVELTLHDQLTDGSWRVSVWGADDFGMNFDFGTEIDAQNMYFALCMKEKVNIKELEKLGFTRF